MPDKYMRLFSLSLFPLFLSRALLSSAYVLYLPPSKTKPLAKAIGSLGSGLGTGFCDVQSDAAKNKISLLSLCLPFTAPFRSSIYQSLSLARPFSRPSSVCLSSSLFILSVRVPLRTFRLGRSKEPSGGEGGARLDRSLLNPDNHRPIIDGRSIVKS